jgi:hypothetical protein
MLLKFKGCKKKAGQSGIRLLASAAQDIITVIHKV